MSLPSVALVGYPNFEAFLFSIPLTVFSLAVPERLFTVATVTVDGLPIQADGGLRLCPDGDIGLLESVDIVIVPGWHSLDARPEPALQKALLRAHEHGAWVVGLCYGAYALAYAGLLDGRRASTHWMAENDFRSRFPNVLLNTNSLYVGDGMVVTSAGSGAGVDCCLFLVREHYGIRVANRIARTMVMPPFREGGQAQFMEEPDVVSADDDRIGKVMDYMRAHLQEEHTLDSLARRAAMSRRTFTRHFEKATGMSVLRWLTSQRLRRSCELLEATTLSVEEIARETGFQEASLFRHHFRAHFKVSPKTWRRNFGTPEKNG